MVLPLTIFSYYSILLFTSRTSLSSCWQRLTNCYTNCLFAARNLVFWITTWNCSCWLETSKYVYCISCCFLCQYDMFVLISFFSDCTSKNVGHIFVSNIAWDVLLIISRTSCLYCSLLSFNCSFCCRLTSSPNRSISICFASDFCILYAKRYSSLENSWSIVRSITCFALS